MTCERDWGFFIVTLDVRADGLPNEGWFGFVF